ncbi:hypothetical protein M2451_000424 [Dysgonomonas sp. PFB1-18]|uniref:hypothetical protein n=1 Tax=unclassified Dysgonomonas TaxID=2630389 RepID=UPI002472F10F|nr:MULTISPECIES: hypothetical protein [unclassified Dysgonomonas]MDH6307275.1 hypothetical protein [Dysgonomonas sp. PF1-14]MDH6337193.1 hypothetical protein [Dysgonomonas sp. PF1-16]MDH6379117.1 hypothetical protein [Dysgonomonas sp. PFB1-18]MDH6396246.1 hypothetical protein [Dysgonomonas sp. PF1-23]
MKALTRLKGKKRTGIIILFSIWGFLCITALALALSAYYSFGYHLYHFTDSSNGNIKQFAQRVCNGEEKNFKLSEIFGNNIKKAYFVPANSYNLKQNNLPFAIPESILDCEMCSYLIILQDDGTIHYVYGACKTDFIGERDGINDIFIYTADDLLIIKELTPESLISISYQESEARVIINIPDGKILELEAERYEW